MTAQTEMVAAVRSPQSEAQQRKYHTCPGCGGTQHKGGRIHYPAYDRICSCCYKVGHFARV